MTTDEHQKNKKTKQRNKMATTQLERESLEAHVDLCAIRYEHLDNRLTELEEKVDEVHDDILSGQKSLIKVIIGTAGTVITGIIPIALTLIVK